MAGPIMAPMSVRVTSTTAPVSVGVGHEAGQANWIGPRGPRNPAAATTAVVPTPSTAAVNAMIKMSRSR